MEGNKIIKQEKKFCNKFFIATFTCFFYNSYIYYLNYYEA